MVVLVVNIMGMLVGVVLDIVVCGGGTGVDGGGSGEWWR